MEIKLLSLQAQLLRYMMQNKSYIELDTADGQHFRVDLNGNKTDTYRLNSSSNFPINETIRVLIPAAIMNNASKLDEFLFLTIQTDGTWDENNATDIAQRTAAAATDPDQGSFFQPASMPSSYKMDSGGRSKSIFSSKKVNLFAGGSGKGESDGGR